MAVPWGGGGHLVASVGVGVAALGLGLVLAWVLAGSLVRPLRGLAQTARRVEGGDLGARTELAGSSEQREVAVAFNDMTERLSKSLAAQRDFVGNASHQLRTPLTGLRLRLEAAALKANDSTLVVELEAAEREAERLGRLLTALLTLASEGERPAPRRPTEVGSAARRSSSASGAAAPQVASPAPGSASRSCVLWPGGGEVRRRSPTGPRAGTRVEVRLPVASSDVAARPAARVHA